MKSAGLNRVYRLVWSQVRQTYIAAAEFARSRRKHSKCAIIAASLLMVGTAQAAGLPGGGQVVAGSGSISQTSNTLTVTQTSNRMATNWQQFSIGQGKTVNFVQPSASSVALNRVLGSDPSVIQGALHANGQVFLVNPNGVLFSSTARVNVGGIVASTLNITNKDFMAGHYRFAGSSTAAVRNEGSVIVGTGGSAAFIAAHIENTGSINAPQGNVLMGAGNDVRLDLGGPVKIEVKKGALNALIKQGGAIHANGGLVYLTAKAAGDLASAAINHTGITEAKTLVTGQQGAIYLMGDMAHGQVNVGGTLNASAPAGGKGGFIETSAAKVKVQSGAQVQAGHWLIDPNDFTIAATGGDITGAALGNALGSGSVTIKTSLTGVSCTGVTGCGTGSTGNGDIFVKNNVTWASGNTFTLNAYRNIRILATIDASGGSGGKVVLDDGQGAPASGNTATYDFGLTGTGFTGKIKLHSGPNFTTKLGSNGIPVNWTVITKLGLQGSTTKTDLQGINGNLSGNYVLGANIDATATSGWNNGTGFTPIGFVYITNSNPALNFTGRFDGLGHTISGLTINRPSANYEEGLFGRTSGATFGNVGLVGGRVSGKGYVGELVGQNENGGTITNSYATGSVSGGSNVGGLVGRNYSTITNSYATGRVSGGTYYVGGLVGQNSGTITNSYATGKVSGSYNVGGLAGYNTGTITHSFWDTQATGQSGGSGGTGKTTAEMKSLATFTGGAGWNIDDTGGTGKVWRIYNGNSYPLLRSFLTPLTVTANSGSRAYDGTTTSSLGVRYFTTPNANLLGTATVTASAKDVGIRALNVSGLYSNQSGYDISNVAGTLNIAAKALSASYVAANKVYDGNTSASVTGSSSNIVTGDTVTFGQSAVFNNKNVGTGKTVNISSIALGGTDAGNYVLQNTTATASADIAVKALTASYVAANKVYDGNTIAALTSGSLSGVVGSDAVNLVTGTGSFANKNVGIGKAVTVAGTTLSGTGAGNYTVSNPTGLMANITAKGLIVTGQSATSKTYDGNTMAALTGGSLSGVVGSDAVNFVTGTGSFANKNVGIGKAVTVAGTTLSGTGEGNYTVSNPTGLIANIAAKALSASYVAANKVYDGNTSASVTGSSSNIVAGDSVSFTQNAAFNNKNVGINKTVNINGITLGGLDAGNYALQNNTATAHANITSRPVTTTSNTGSTAAVASAQQLVDNSGNARPANGWQQRVVAVKGTGIKLPAGFTNNKKRK